MLLKYIPDDELVSYRDDCRDFLSNTKESQSAYIKATNELFKRLKAGKKAITTINKVVESNQPEAKERAAGAVLKRLVRRKRRKCYMCGHILLKNEVSIFMKYRTTCVLCAEMLGLHLPRSDRSDIKWK